MGWILCKYRPSGQIDTGCRIDNKWHGPVHTVYPDNDMRFSLCTNGEETGQFVWIDADRAVMHFCQQVRREKHGERRIFTLDKIDMWIDGECTDEDIE